MLNEVFLFLKFRTEKCCNFLLHIFKKFKLYLVLKTLKFKEPTLIMKDPLT